MKELSITEYRRILEALSECGIPWTNNHIAQSLREIADPKYGDIASYDGKYYVYLDEWVELIADE